MNAFDLHAAVAHVLDTTDLANPREIASKVAENVPARRLREALTAALDPYVREAIQHRRRHNPIIRGARAPRSAKLEAYRDWWASWLRDPVYAGPDNGWKLLGDCTYEDLMFAAEQRREKAGQILASADQFTALAELVHEHGAGHVSDLSMDMVRDRFGDTAWLRDRFGDAA